MTGQMTLPIIHGPRSNWPTLVDQENGQSNLHSHGILVVKIGLWYQNTPQTLQTRASAHPLTGPIGRKDPSDTSTGDSQHPHPGIPGA